MWSSVRKGQIFSGWSPFMSPMEVPQTRLLEADNWVCVKPGAVGPQPHSQTPSSSEDAPPGRR